MNTLDEFLEWFCEGDKGKIEHIKTVNTEAELLSLQKCYAEFEDELDD